MQVNGGSTVGRDGGGGGGGGEVSEERTGGLL